MRRLNIPVLLPILFALALAGYFLPWILMRSSTLSLGAYDLAEWSSLHPVVRQSTPFLWTALVLRIPLAVLGVLIAVYLGNKFHFKPIAVFCLLVAAIALLPPLEFFTTFRDDPNYRQQFVLALLMLLIGIPIVIKTTKRTQGITLFTLSTLGALASIIGIFQAQHLIKVFGLHFTIGFGGMLTIIAFAAVSFLYIIKQSS